MLKLFTAHNSICTQKVFLTLIEKDLAWTSEYIDLFKNEQYRPEYLKLNPKGVVPTLIHDGHAVIESTLICEHLDQTFPDPSLVPASAYERSQMRRWSKHIDEGVFEATREISFSAMFRDKMKAMTQEQRDGRFRNIGDPGRRARMISTYEQGCDSLFVEQGIFAFEKLFQEMEDALAPRAWYSAGNPSDRCRARSSFARRFTDGHMPASDLTPFGSGAFCFCGRMLAFLRPSAKSLTRSSSLNVLWYLWRTRESLCVDSLNGIK
jgi:glutathione S-transferase